MSTPSFPPPDAGTWTLDASHQTRPVPRLLHAPIERSFRRGFAEGFADVGSLLEALEVRYVSGWAYMTVRPVGARPGASGPPPRWLFRLLQWVHPALRARNAAADTVFERRPWAAQVAAWHEARGPWWTARLRGLQAVDPETLDEAARVVHLRALLGALHDLGVEHFGLAARCTPAVGDFLVAALDRGLSPARAAGALTGASRETVRPRECLLDVGRAAREAGVSLEGPPGQVMARLLGDPRTTEPLARYLDDHGWRVVDGEELTGRVLHERPEVVVAGVRGARVRPGVVPDLSDDPSLAARLEEARLASSTREHSGSLVLWAAGLVRRAVLALGRRWVAEGRAPADDAPYHLLEDELDDPPSRDELARRAADFEAWARATPPSRLGPASFPPPAEWLPPGQQRLTRAVMAFVDRFDRELDRVGDDPLEGIPASPGVIEGRAHRLDQGLEGLAEGDILVAASTSPTINHVVPFLGGLVTELGGLVSHPAIVARELGIPGVVGCRDLMALVPHGSWIRVDGTRGKVELLAERAPSRPGVPLDLSEVEVAATVPDADGAWLPLAEAADGARFGGKAVGLAVALGAGLPVPVGLALDVDLVQGVAAGSPRHVRRLEEALAALPESAWAVRSSAVGEDGAAASFAGRHATVLGVRGIDAVVAAVGEVWRSAHGAGARAYRERLGVGGAAAMAVVVQVMVDADVAGVCFGRDPVTGDAVRVVEATPGLGVAVVEGRVRPDRARLSPDGRVLELVVQPDAPALDARVLAAVHALGAACDDRFGAAQDVEWAMEGDRCWLLQSRAITGGAP